MRSGGVVAFLERIVKDTEFREWYVSEPDRALASHGLDGHSLQELYAALKDEGPYPDTVRTLRPLAGYMVECWQDGEETRETLVRQRFRRLSQEIESLKGRPELSEAYLVRQRPWWKFWKQ